ncbi:MFS transporter [Undibacterium sp. SXout7W]|uniref:MFS transporter n=1 Tax=Undibacterium sp. SXout7W TaxID=3413049 RepID=UPI003BF1A287
MMKQTDVHKLIDEAKFTRFHWTLLFWCALVIIFDGYDLVIYGVVLPKLMAEWSLSPLQAGALGSYALFGMMFGAMFFGPLSDKIGRKKVIAICVTLFSLFTFINGFASNVMEFGVCRFIAGLGIGGVMPNVVALMTEYSPKKIRSLLVTIMFSGYSVGGMMSAGLGIWLIPSYGWSAVFFVAIIPFLLLPLILYFLPDSPAFLLRSNGNEKMGKLLQRIEPSYLAEPNAQYTYATGNTSAQAPLLALFKDGRMMTTFMFWLSFFMCLLMVYALGSWLPKLMNKAGYPLGSSLMFLMVLNIGAIFGAIGGGWLADKFPPRRILGIFFVIAACSISLLGIKSNTLILNLLVAIAGATTIGSQILLYAYVAQYYPLRIRSTGIGWASGVGRSGAILGPILGGSLLSMNLPLEFNFYVFAIPGAIACIAISLSGRGGHIQVAQTAPA